MPTRQRAEDVAELSESEKYASYSDLRLGEGRVLGPGARFTATTRVAGLARVGAARREPVLRMPSASLPNTSLTCRVMIPWLLRRSR